MKRLVIGNHSRDDRFKAKNKSRLFGWYEAYSRFMQLATDHRFLINVRLEPGDIVVVHNARVLHGRPEYKQSEGELRCLEALHFDRDSVYSKLRAKMAGN